MTPLKFWWHSVLYREIYKLQILIFNCTQRENEEEIQTEFTKQQSSQPSLITAGYPIHIRDLRRYSTHVLATVLLSTHYYVTFCIALLYYLVLPRSLCRLCSSSNPNYSRFDGLATHAERWQRVGGVFSDYNGAVTWASSALKLNCTSVPLFPLFYTCCLSRTPIVLRLPSRAFYRAHLQQQSKPNQNRRNSEIRPNKSNIKSLRA